MVDHGFAQVVLHPLAQNAGQVNEGEHREGLHDDKPGVQRRKLAQPHRVARHNSLVHHLRADVGEQRIQAGNDRNEEQEADDPAPVRARQTGDPPQRVAADLAFELFFLKHELFSHGSLDLAVAGRIDT